MKISEQLRAAKALISDERHWIQEQYCNTHLLADSTCFCSLGAIHKVLTNSLQAPDKNDLTVALGRGMGGWTEIAEFNDTHNHAEVMQAWDNAISLAEQAEAHEGA